MWSDTGGNRSKVAGKLTFAFEAGSKATMTNNYYAVFIDDDELMLKAIRRTSRRLIPNWDAKPEVLLEDSLVDIIFADDGEQDIIYGDASDIVYADSSDIVYGILSDSLHTCELFTFGRFFIEGS